MLWIVGGGLLLLACAIGVMKGTKARNSGMVGRERASGFMQNAEEFCLNFVPFQELVKELSTKSWNNINVKMNYDVNTQSINFSFSCVSGYWYATLFQKNQGNQKIVYRFEYKEWKNESSVAILGPANATLTQVENTFLNFDANTQVSIIPLKVTHKSSFF